MNDNHAMRALAVALAVTLCAANAPADSPDRPTTTSVKIQLNWLPEPEFGGIYAATRGAFAAHGLEVEILKGGPDVPAVQMAAAGRVEFAVAAADEVIVLREQGADIVGLFATYQKSPQAIMVRQTRPVAGVKALLDAGGTLVAQPGLAYLKWLGAHFDMSKTRIVPYGSGAMAQFLNPRSTDLAMQCFITAEPIAARRMGVESKVFLIADTGFNPYTAVVVTRRDFLESHRERCRAFVAALREGWRAYLDDPAPANREMAKLNTAMDLAAFDQAAVAQKELIEGGDALRLGLGAMTEQRWSQLAQQLLDLRIIDAPVPALACFVNLE